MKVGWGKDYQMTLWEIKAVKRISEQEKAAKYNLGEANPVEWNLVVNKADKRTSQ